MNFRDWFKGIGEFGKFLAVLREYILIVFE